MPTIAQKLCDDIVEPILKSSKIQNNILSNEKKNLNNQNGRAVQSSYSQRRQVISKNQSYSSNTSHGLKKDVSKKYENSAINTEITGQLRCNNNCITLLRKRDNHVLCRCNNNKQSNFKLRSKEIQTINKKDCSLKDKSCTHCVETVSCGTQLFDDSNSILKKNGSRSRSKTNITIKLQESNQSLTKLCNDIKEYETFIENNLNNIQKKQIKSYTSPISKYVEGRYWAISNYPARGPDF